MAFIGEAPQQAFLRACGPAKISGVATPELLAVCARLSSFVRLTYRLFVCYNVTTNLQGANEYET